MNKADVCLRWHLAIYWYIPIIYSRNIQHFCKILKKIKYPNTHKFNFNFLLRESPKQTPLKANYVLYLICAKTEGKKRLWTNHFAAYAWILKLGKFVNKKYLLLCMQSWTNVRLIRIHLLHWSEIIS